MRGWRQRERQQMRDGQARQEGEGKDRKEGKRKSSGNPSCKSPVHCCKWGGGKKHPPQKFKDASICHLHVIVYTYLLVC